MTTVDRITAAEARLDAIRAKLADTHDHRVRRTLVGQVQFLEAGVRKLRAEARAEEVDPTWRDRVTDARSSFAAAQAAVEAEEAAVAARVAAQSAPGRAADFPEPPTGPTIVGRQGTNERSHYEHLESRAQHRSWVRGLASVPIGSGLVMPRASLKLQQLRLERDQVKTYLVRLEAFPQQLARYDEEERARTSPPAPFVQATRDANAARFAAKVPLEARRTPLRDTPALPGVANRRRPTSDVA